MNIVIIGGGIGGLATANALLKKRFNVQVYERAKVLRPIGAGLSLTPNGLNSLNAVQSGIAQTLIKAGSPIHTLILKRSTGETLASKPMDTMQKYGQPMLMIQWSKLQAILASVLPPEIIHLQHRCVGFEEQNDSVKVYFPGGKTVQADLLIGADGINSVVRQGIIGDGFPSYAGRMSWRAIVRYSHEQLSPNTTTVITSSNGQNSMLMDLGDGYTFWGTSALSADDYVNRRATDAKTHALEILAGWAEPVGAIITATPAADIVERPICDRSPLEHWSKGRVTLLGDAAHPVVPSLGQGANMAFEDAYELAECLAVAPNIEAALNAYENSRIPRTAIIYDRSATQGYKAYQPDSENTFTEMMKPSFRSQDDFEAWLYRYNPIAQKRKVY